MSLGYNRRRRGFLTGKFIGPSSFSAIANLIDADDRDINILVIGDSTGNDTTDWVYQFFSGPVAPTHSIIYRLWDNIGLTYSVPSTLSTGTGSHDINVWNQSVAGARAVDPMGGKFAASILATNPDLIIWNTGINSSNAGTALLVRSELISAIEDVRRAFPDIPHVAIIQQPNRDNNSMQIVSDAWHWIKDHWPNGLQIIDLYSSIIALGKPSAFYADAVHFNSTGTAYEVDLIQSWWDARRLGIVAVDPPWTSISAASLTLNSDFADFDGASPDNWDLVGTVTATKDVVIVDTGHTYSVELLGTAGLPSIRQLPSSAAFQNKTISIFVRQFTPDGAAATVGRFSFSYTSAASGNFTVTSRGSEPSGGWHSIMLAGIYVPPDAANVTVRLYHDTAGTPDSNPVYYSQANVAVSEVPRGI